MRNVTGGLKKEISHDPQKKSDLAVAPSFVDEEWMTDLAALASTSTVLMTASAAHRNWRNEVGFSS